jgi:hypothetical protein
MKQPAPRRARRLGCWPTAGQQLLLRAALLDGADGRAAWDAWAPAADFQRLDDGSVRLLPLLYANVSRWGLDGPLLAALKGVHRRSWYRSQVLFREAGRLVSTLQAEGLEPVLLKGVPLALLYYPDVAARPMGDVDLLVHPADTARAVEVFAREGWHPAHSPRAWPAEPRKSWAFSNANGREVDLHWRVFRSGRIPDDDIRARAMPMTIGETAAHTLAAGDQLLHVIAHGVVWNPVPSIRWVADAALIVRRAGASIDWDQVCREAARRRLLPTLGAALMYLRTQVQTPIPIAVVERIARMRPPLLERLSFWSNTQPGVVGGAVRTWFDYAHYAADGGEPVGLPGFWRYLSGIWQTSGDAPLPARIVERVRHRLAHAPKRADPS